MENGVGNTVSASVNWGKVTQGKKNMGEKKKKSLTVDTVLSITALNDCALPRTLYSTSRYS